MPTGNDVQLVYDGECPICDFYAKRIDLSECSLVRVNAREESGLLDEITAAGLDIDKGMVLKVDDSIYYGSDALREVALLSSRKGLFNKVAAVLFRSPRVAKAVYPVLVACRNLLLRVLGRTRINNLGIENRDRF